MFQCLYLLHAEDAVSLPEDESSTIILDLHGKSDQHIEYIILHEFGHVLGLGHEHQHPTYCQVMKNLKLLKEYKIYELTGLNFVAGGLYSRYIKPVSKPGCDFEYDPKSIMNYP